MLVVLDPLGRKQINRDLPIQPELVCHHDRPSNIIPRSPSHRGIADEGMEDEQSLDRSFARLIDTLQLILGQSEETLCRRPRVKGWKRSS